MPHNSFTSANAGRTVLHNLDEPFVHRLLTAEDFMKIDWDFLLTTAAWLAARTETKIDDMLVALLQAAKDDPLIGSWFAKATAAGTTTEVGTDGTLSLMLVDTAEPPAEITQALFDRGIFKGAKDAAEVASKLKELLPYALELMKFVKLFTGA